MWKISCTAGDRLIAHRRGHCSRVDARRRSLPAFAGGNIALRGGQAAAFLSPRRMNPCCRSARTRRCRSGGPIVVGLNKSVMVELPRELRDVIVSNPEFMDAVVQSSNRVYLIGKKIGNANVFFFDSTASRS